MPELPEVETIRRILLPDLVDKTISAIEVLSAKQFSGTPARLIGKVVTGLDRTGKVINVLLTGSSVLNIHLKMTGQLLYAPDAHAAVFENAIPFANSAGMPAKTTRIIIGFEDGSALYFNDLRKFGWMKLTEWREGPASPDPLSPAFTDEYLASVLSATRRPVKTVLLDQEKIAGIGNIYANDALFLAGIHPRRTALSLDKKGISRLRKAVVEVITQGIEDQGSTGGDKAFVLPDGTPGMHQRRFLVYDREGQKCPGNCGGTVERIKQGGRSSYFCPKCQT